MGFGIVVGDRPCNHNLRDTTSLDLFDLHISIILVGLIGADNFGGSRTNPTWPRLFDVLFSLFLFCSTSVKPIYIF
jgi:hypothetical protein